MKLAEVEIGGPSGVYGFGDIGTLGEGVNRLVMPVFSIAVAVVVIFILIGAFNFLTAGGDKERVASARNMIAHALIGFVLLIFAFLLMQYILPAFGIDFGII